MSQNQSYFWQTTRHNVYLKRSAKLHMLLALMAVLTFSTICVAEIDAAKNNDDPALEMGIATVGWNYGGIFDKRKKNATGLLHIFVGHKKKIRALFIFCDHCWMSQPKQMSSAYFLLSNNKYNIYCYYFIIIIPYLSPRSIAESFQRWGDIC